MPLESYYWLKVYALCYFKVIILPGAICLSKKDLDHFNKFLQKGGGILATWQFGNRDLNGDWRGVEYMQKWLGTTPVNTEISVNNPISLQLRYGQPGTSNIDPGQFLHFSPAHSAMYLPATDDVTINGYWSQDMYVEMDPAKIPRQAGFITHSLKSGGRIGWIGSKISDILQDDPNKQNAEKVLKELVQWLSGGAVAAIEPWPRNFKNAMLIHGDFSSSSENFLDFSSVFKQYSFKTCQTFSPDDFSKDPAIAKRMLSDETDLIFSDDIHKPISEESLDSQVNYLNSRITQFVKYDIMPAGFMPSNRRLTEETLNAASLANLSSILADRLSDRVYPHLAPPATISESSSQILLYPKAELTVSEIVNDLNQTDQYRIAAIVLQDYERIGDMGGLYKFCYSSQDVSSKVLRNVAESLITRAFTEKNTWIASATEINTWIRQRENITTSVAYKDNYTEITVQNNGTEVVKHTSIRVLPPSNIPLDKISTKTVSATSTFDVLGDAMFLHLPKLEPNQIYTAVLEKRGGIPLNANTKRLLLQIFKFVVVISLIFLAAFVWYFAISKRNIKGIMSLDPDGNVVNELATNDSHQSIYKQGSEVTQPPDVKPLAIQPPVQKPQAKKLPPKKSPDPVQEQDSKSGQDMQEQTKLAAAKSEPAVSAAVNSSPDSSEIRSKILMDNNRIKYFHEFARIKSSISSVNTVERVTKSQSKDFHGDQLFALLNGTGSQSTSRLTLPPGRNFVPKNDLKKLQATRTQPQLQAKQQPKLSSVEKTATLKPIQDHGKSIPPVRAMGNPAATPKQPVNKGSVNRQSMQNTKPTLKNSFANNDFPDRNPGEISENKEVHGRFLLRSTAKPPQAPIQSAARKQASEFTRAVNSPARGTAAISNSIQPQDRLPVKKKKPPAAQNPLPAQNIGKKIPGLSKQISRLSTSSSRVTAPLPGAGSSFTPPIRSDAKISGRILQQPAPGKDVRSIPSGIKPEFHGRPQLQNNQMAPLPKKKAEFKPRSSPIVRNVENPKSNISMRATAPLPGRQQPQAKNRPQKTLNHKKTSPQPPTDTMMEWK